jgi:hypothetical protein
MAALLSPMDMPEAARHLDAWLKAAGITQGALFSRHYPRDELLRAGRLIAHNISYGKRKKY